MNILDKFLVNTYERVAFKSYTLSKFHKADRYFRKILEIEPDRTGTCYNLGTVNYSLGNYDEAERYVGRERARIGDTYEICRALGDIYWMKRDRESAYRFFKTAKELAMNEKDKALMSRKMGLCSSDKSFEDAHRAKELFVDADKLMADKKYEEAEDLYLEGIDKDPSNFFALNNLGVIAMNIRMDYPLAEKYFMMGDEISDFRTITDNMISLAKLRKKTGR